MPIVNQLITFGIGSKFPQLVPTFVDQVIPSLPSRPMSKIDALLNAFFVCATKAVELGSWPRALFC